MHNVLHSSFIPMRGVMPERLMDTMGGGQQTLQLSQIAASSFGTWAYGLSLLSMASGVLLLVLRWGDLTGFLTH